MAGTALQRTAALLAVAVVLPVASAEDVVAAAGATRSGPISGGAATRSAFDGWLRRWREHYVEGLTAVPEVLHESLPAALRGVQPKVFEDEQAGVLPQELGYALMVEGFQAAAGDSASLDYGLSLLRAWVGLASAGSEDSATGAASAHFGVLSTQDGSSTGVDADAVLGMIYLSEALGHPDDFVEMVVRAIIGFASDDLGFPNLYRTLPDGTRLFVPKSGSKWGGLQPESGQHATAQAPWCYTPSSFSPAHLRTFRDFASQHWRTGFDAHLPPRQDDSGTTLADLAAGFDGSIVAGYNILYWSSCQSGAVSNWVGVKAPCPDGALACDGVPWASTPFVGEAGTCSGSGSPFGSFGPDASQTPWRIALDYVLYPEESSEVPVYSRAGIIDEGLQFGSVIYLRRFATHYRQNAQCDGGNAESCLLRGKVAAFRLAHAFEPGAPSLTCEGVPNPGHDWWASFMSYPTFTAFVAPSDDLPREQSAIWLDNLASLCVFGDGDEPKGYLCSFSYFELDQELVSTMIMAGAVQPLKVPSAVSQPPVDSAGRTPVESASRLPVDFASGPSSDALTPTTSRSSQDAAVEAFSSGEQEERTASEGSDQTDLFPAGNELIVEEEDQQAKMAKAAEEFRLAREAGNETAEAEAILQYDSAMTAWEQEQALRPRVQELEKEQSAEVVMEVDDARAVEAKEERDQEEESKWAAEFQKAKERGDKKAEEKAVVTFEKAKESLEKDEAQQKRQDLQHRKEEEALQKKEEALKEEIAEVALSAADQAEADARRFPRQDGLESRQDAVPKGAPAPGVGKGFCCLHADSKNDFCGTCHPKAVTKPDSWCAQNEEQCLTCGGDAHWCQGPLLTGLNSSASLPIIEDASLRGSWEFHAKHKATPALPAALLGLGLLVAAAGVARVIPARGNHGYSLAAQPLEMRAVEREAEVAE